MTSAQAFAGRGIRGVADMPWHGFDAHSGAHMLRAAHEWMDPFLGVDSFLMPQPFFPPHPHAGMSAVTLMLPEAEAGFVNRDSLGDRSIIHPGDLHWTQAGSGMLHEEIPQSPGRAAHGMQIFVNLASAHKHVAPVAFHVSSADMPLVRLPGASVRVVAGSFAGRRSPIAADPRWLTRVHLLDVTLQPAATLDIEVAVGDNAFFVVRSGALHTPQGIRNGGALFFEPHGGAARLQAGVEILRGVFFAGTPLGEAVVSRGPFTGSSAAEIDGYIHRFMRGDMGHLEKSF